MRRAALILFAAAFPAVAADQWVRVTTPEFELFTSNGEKNGKETVRHFEQVRAFFLKASPVRGSADFPVRIIEFTTDDQYQPFRDNVSAAYFFSGPARDYIVLGPLASVNYSLAIHEYMHLIIRHSGLKIPLWLNEGWSDVYSTLRPMGNETAVGDLLADRMDVLTRDKWLDFDELTSTDRNSPNYHEASRVGMFYAESWALAHMLYLSPEYKDNFGKFVMALHRGSSTAEACRIAFDRTPEAVYKDLKAYFNRKKIYGRVFEAGMNKRDVEPAASPVPAFDARLMLADLMVGTRRLDEAKKEYAHLEKEQPDRSDVARGIGNMALATRDRETARRYFQKAFDAGDADAEMCLQLAELDAIAKERPDKIVPILERALKSKPDFTEVKVRLGLAMVDARDFAGGIATLMAIPNVTSEQAPKVFCGVGYAYIETGDIAAARQNAETCRKWAKTDADVSRADELLKLADARSSPQASARAGEKLQRIAGTARNLECAPGGIRLQIVAGNKLINFDIPEPDAVETTQKPPGFTLACGTLKPIPIIVEFAPPRSAIETSVGVVRRLVFSVN